MLFKQNRNYTTKIPIKFQTNTEFKKQVMCEPDNLLILHHIVTNVKQLESNYF